MSYGHLSPAQRKALKPFIQGQHIHDLGAGDQVLSQQLLRLGCTHVTAVDKQPSASKRFNRITWVTSYFVHYHDPLDTAFLSWPQNYRQPGLVSILERSRLVIYLGSNTGGSACGDRDLWLHLTSRELLAYSPDPANTLAVYGPARTTREPQGEELAALTNLSHMWSYWEAEGLPQPRQSARGPSPRL